MSINDLADALLKVMGSDQAPEYGPERSVNAVPRRLAETRVPPSSSDSSPAWTSTKAWSAWSRGGVMSKSAVLRSLDSGAVPLRAALER